MTEAELKLQPRDVREAFETIADSDVSHVQQVRALSAKLDAAMQKLKPEQVAYDRIRAVIAWLQGELSSVESQVADIDAKRSAVIADALIAADGQGFPDDEKLLEQITDLQTYLDRLKLAGPGLAVREREARRCAELAGGKCQDIRELLNDCRDRAKLAEARRRCGY